MARCAIVSTPSQSCRPRNCSCRSARHATCWSRGRAPRKYPPPRKFANSFRPLSRRFTTPHDATPRTHLLSNGRYAVMLTAAGSGYSRWRDIAITRWREDATRDCWGCYIFLRDSQTGDVWSAGYQPRGVEADSYEVSFYEDRAEFIRRDRSLTTAARSRRLVRGRRGNAPGLHHQPGDARARNSGDVLRRDLPHVAGRRCRASRVFQSVRGDRICARCRRAACHAPQAIRQGNAVWAAHVSAVEGETSRRLAIRNRSRAVSRARSRHSQSRLDRRRAAAFEYRRAPCSTR